MRMRWILTVTAASTFLQPDVAVGQQHQNPVIDLLSANKPVFGLYAPANRRARPGQPAPATAEPQKTAAQLAADAVAYKRSDYLFDGSMEGNFDTGIVGFTEFANAISAAGTVQNKRFTHPLFVKMLTGGAGIRDILFSDDVSVEGSKLDLLQFFALLDQPDPVFNIVTP